MSREVVTTMIDALRAHDDALFATFKKRRRGIRSGWVSNARFGPEARMSARFVYHRDGGFALWAGDPSRLFDHVPHRIEPDPVAAAAWLAEAFLAVAPASEPVGTNPVDEVTAQGSDDAPDLGVAEAAAYLRVSRPYVLNLMRKGLLPSRGLGSELTIPRAALVAYREAQEQPGLAALEALMRETGELGH